MAFLEENKLVPKLQCGSENPVNKRMKPSIQRVRCTISQNELNPLLVRELLIKKKKTEENHCNAVQPAWSY